MKIIFTLFISFLYCFADFKKPDLDPKISFKPPVYVEELPSKEDRLKNENSSLLMSKNGWFSDSKAKRRNDLLTVVIKENITASNNSNKKLTKQNNVNLGGGNIAYNGGGNSALAGELAVANSYINHSITSNTNNDYTGSGTSSSNSNIETTITVRVIKVLNNGNFFVSGRRELLVNGQKQIVQISGVVSKDNISANNRVDSTFLADLKLMYVNQGDVGSTTEQGWGSKAVQSLWPF